MDSTRLVDYTRIDPIPYRKSLALLDEFLINSAQFLNRFSYLCEHKLLEVSRSIHRLEITMSILEAKLASIPLDSGEPAPAPQAPAAPNAPPPPETQQEAGEEQPAAAPTGGLTWKDDPRYAGYFRMLRVGVPQAQIAMKMSGDGLDPSILDSPDGPSDYVPGASDESDSDSDFSDGA